MHNLLPVAHPLQSTVLNLSSAHQLVFSCHIRQGKLFTCRWLIDNYFNTSLKIFSVDVRCLYLNQASINLITQVLSWEDTVILWTHFHLNVILTIKITLGKFLFQKAKDNEPMWNMYVCLLVQWVIKVNQLRNVTSIFNTIWGCYTYLVCHTQWSHYIL